MIYRIFFLQLFYYLLEKDSKIIEESSYYKLYKSGYSVFKNYPLVGVGNKNFRVEVCESDLQKIIKYDYLVGQYFKSKGVS